MGTINKGFSIAMVTLDGGRINIAAQSLGIVASLFDEALIHAKTREQWGKKLWDHQVNRHYFADSYAELLSGWFTVFTASQIRDEQKGKRITMISSPIKLTATETALRVAIRMARMFGGSLATEEITKKIDACDKILQALVTTIYEGSSEMQKEAIATHL